MGLCLCMYLLRSLKLKETFIIRKCKMKKVNNDSHLQCFRELFYGASGNADCGGILDIIPQ